MRRLKIGIALGGGGARGLAHIGVLRVLERNSIPIDIVTGTSIGALVGALYALDKDISLVEKKARDIINDEDFRNLKVELLQETQEKTFVQKVISHLKQNYLYNLTLTRLSLVSQDKVENIINKLFPDKDIRETKIPFAAVATDLTKGEEVVFREGPIKKAIQASTAIAGIFPPLFLSKSWLIDGGIISMVPVRAAFEMGADLVIAVDVKSRIRRKSTIHSGFEVINRANYIRGMVINKILLKEADVIISPAVKNIHWADFKKISRIVKKGEYACESKIPEIQEKIKQRLRSTFITRLFNPFFTLGKKCQ